MREKETKKLYNSMTNVREEYIEECMEKAPERGKHIKHPIWLGWGMAAACLCLVTIAVFIVIDPFGSSSEEELNANKGPIQLVSDVRPPEADRVTDKEGALTDGDSKEFNLTRDGETMGKIKTAAQDPAIQDPITPDMETPDQEMGVMISGPDIANWDPSQITPMISSYKNEGGVEACYAVPANGTYGYSMPLRGAMKEYGDTVLYRVVVEVFQDDVRLDADSEAVKEERKRLGELGYIVSFEQYKSDYGREVHSYFTLHAKEEELISFAQNDDYGYMLWLYDERVGSF